MAKLWGGRFTGATDPVMEKFNNSIGYDKIMWSEDIQGSVAYAQALGRCGILTAEEATEIVNGLGKVRAEWESGGFELKQGDEDIHTANERRLTELIGKLGGKLHTGRSRNDQVATDVRLWLRTACERTLNQLNEIVVVATRLGEAKIDVLQAGFTHLQPAQVVRFSHWLMSYIVPLTRDMERLKELSRRVNVCPLGSGALAGHPFGLDRAALGEALGFNSISLNSMDATSDRDFVAEFMSWASLLMVHLSQFAEDNIILNMQKCMSLSIYSTNLDPIDTYSNPISYITPYLYPVREHTYRILQVIFSSILHHSTLSMLYFNTPHNPINTPFNTPSPPYSTPPLRRYVHVSEHTYRLH